MELEALKALAVSMLEKAYCPYSHFPVGAALECADGSVYTGCNVENAVYPAGICAERNAIFHAVAEGHTRDLVRLVIAGRSEDFCVPCGICRQVMQEFCDPDFLIYMGRGDDSYEAVPLAKLLPYGFNAAEYMTDK